MAIDATPGGFASEASPSARSVTRRVSGGGVTKRCRRNGPPPPNNQGANLIGCQSVGISFGGVVEVGHEFGDPSVTFGISGGTLILDRAPPKSLGSHIQFSLNTTTDKIELGHLDFDAADFIPSAAGSLSGKVMLTEHGKPVYQLSDVSFPVGTSVALSVGTDPATGFHFVVH